MPRTDLQRATGLLLLQRFASGAASIGVVTALGKQVYDLSHRELDLGLLGLAEFAPAALLVLVTGAIADRHDRRLVGAAATAAELLTVLALAWYAATDPTSAAPIFMLVVLFGVGRAFAAPSTRALPADLIPADRLPYFIPRMSGAWQVAAIVGPVLAGLLYAVSPATAYVTQAGLLGVSIVTLLLLPVRPAASAAASAAAMTPVIEAALAVEGDTAGPTATPGATVSQAREGLRFIRRHPILLGAISLDLFAVLFGGAVALLPAIAEDRLGAGAVGLGWLRAATGIGAAITTIGLAMRPVRRHVGRVLLAAVACFGLFTIVLGLTRSYLVAFVALAVLSGADAISVFIRATLVPLFTPEHMRGRVLSVENVFIGASNELGAFESGVAAQVLGTPGAIVLGGAATLAVSAIWWTTFPHLRDVDGFPTSIAVSDS